MTDQAFGGAAAATRACTPHQHIQADRAQTPPSFECPAAHDLCNNSGVSAVNSKVLFLSRVISRPFASLYVCINRCWMRGRSLKGECPFPCRPVFCFVFFLCCNSRATCGVLPSLPCPPANSFLSIRTNTKSERVSTYPCSRQQSRSQKFPSVNNCSL